MQFIRRHFRRAELPLEGATHSASEPIPKVLSDGREHRAGSCGGALWMFRKWPVVPTFLALTFVFAILASIGRRALEGITYDVCGDAALGDDSYDGATTTLLRHMTEAREESEAAANALADEAIASARASSSVSLGPPPSVVERMSLMQRLVRQRLSETELQGLGLDDTRGTPPGPETCSKGSPSSSCQGESATQTDPREAVRRAHGWWLPVCKSISDEIKQQQNSARPTAALTSLAKLSGLERPFWRHISALSAQLGEGSIIQEPHVQQHQHPLEMQELQSLRRESLSCIVDTMREARNLAAVLPTESAFVAKASRCQSRMLTGFQSIVVDEAEKDNSSSVSFALGLFWSDIGIAESAGAGPPPLFGTAPQNYYVSHLLRKHLGGRIASWASGSGSSHFVPEPLAKAEMFLELGEELGTSAQSGTAVAFDQNATGDEMDMSRGATRALKLYQHAKTLAVMHHDAAAEERYQLAAKVASRSRRSRLASHSLTRLSYFLSLRGNRERALEVAEQALLLAADPLAEFLNVTLRRSLGDLKDDAAVLEVERVLKNVTGQLPSKSLEAQRESALAELRLWRSVAVKAETQGIRACFAVRDAAQFLVCVLCRLLFGSDGTT